MRNVCPICGAETFPGARFCRRCGAVLHAVGAGEQVSPQAATVPLQDEATRTTDGLAPEDAARASADTSRVSRAELERLLREHDSNERAAADAARTRPGTSYDPDATIVSPDAVPSSARELDEDLTVSVPRQVTPFDTHETSTNLGAGSSGLTHPTRETGAVIGGATEAFDDSYAAPPTDTHVAAPAPAVQPAPKRKTWPVVVAVCGSVLLLVTVAALLAARFWRAPSPTDAASQAPVAPPPAPDAKQLFDEKLAEAESLLAQGNMEGALARLREANAVDPSNTRGRRRLAELLQASGARREAIEELKAVARLAPEDFTAWRQLAAAQYAEGLHRDAAESYRRLLSLLGDAADPNDLLSYADALRLSGRAEEARATYQRLASNASADVAGLARQRLAELTQPTPTPAEGARPGEAQPGQPQTPGQGETASAAQPVTPNVPQTAPTPAPQSPQAPPPQSPPATTPDARYRRGVELWSSNRAAALNEFQAAAGAGLPDAHYYLGLNYVEGKNIHGLKRAEVVAALQHFQLAQRGGGRFADQARRYTQQLEKEFDRLRRQ